MRLTSFSKPRISPRQVYQSVVVMGFTVLTVNSSVSAQNAEQILGRAGRTYRSLSSLQAEFTQEISDRMVGDFQSKGTLYQAGNNFLLMRFSDPEGDKIVLDGSHAWIYTPSSAPGQVIRISIPADPVYGMNVVAWILDRPTERYRSTWLRDESIGGRVTDVLALEPLSPSLPFTAVTVWIDRQDALPRKVVILENGGARRTLHLSGIRINRNLPEGTFKFSIPHGVRVIDQ